MLLKCLDNSFILRVSIAIIVSVQMLPIFEMEDDIHTVISAAIQWPSGWKRGFARFFATEYKLQSQINVM